MSIGQTDSLLRRFVQTSDAAEQERVLSALLNEHAEPTISKIIRYKTRGATDDGEEIYGDVMLQLVGRLRRLRTEENGQAIEDFNSYVAVTTYNACDRLLSRKYPNRRRLKNGLRYLLTHREGFSLWQNAQGNFVGGFHRWQFADNGGDSSLKIQSLRDDARAFERDAAVEKSWSERKNAYALLTAIFDWTNAPVEIDLLTSVCADWWNVSDETVEIDAAANEKSEERVGIQLADSRPGAETEIERRVYLQKLWDEISDLPTRQRAAVLLNLRDETGRGAIDLWLAVGVSTVEKIAAVLEMSAEAFAELWNDLPLDDNRIAEFLSLTRQQVINLRKSARERLARRMKGF